MKVLNITDLTDKVKETVRKLPPWKIGREGQLQEWFYDYEEADVNHRHISHLYGLYPGNLIHRENTDLLDAAGWFLKEEVMREPDGVSHGRRVYGQDLGTGIVR